MPVTVRLALSFIAGVIGSWWTCGWFHRLYTGTSAATPAQEALWFFSVAGVYMIIGFVLLTWLENR